MRLLLDANVIVDYVGRRQPHFEPAAAVVSMGFFGDATLFMPAKSSTDVYYVLRKLGCANAPLQAALAEFMRVAEPVSLTARDVLRAVELGWDDYEDCLVFLAAEKADADYIVTRDKDGFARSGIPALPPSELMALVRDARGVEYGLESV